MKGDTTTEKRRPPCPLLPIPEGPLSYRTLRAEPGGQALVPDELFDRARAYANDLWMRGLPARALLALCRALYLAPGELSEHRRQPWDVFVWMLRNHQGLDFLGNPRISFVHQATRIRAEHVLKRQRAWALWYLSRANLPHLPPDPKVSEDPPALEELVVYLNEAGLPGEGTSFHDCLRQSASQALFH